jgi:hypothetical protein
MVDGSVRRWTSPKNLNMNSSDDNVFVSIMYFLDEMISTYRINLFGRRSIACFLKFEIYCKQ